MNTESTSSGELPEARLEIEIADEKELEAFARRLAAALPERITLALDGPLGAGKTRFVRALAEAAGTPADLVTSPTFVLLQEYPGPKPIYHFDAYRAKDVDEFWELGPEEYFAATGWTCVEWAERVAECLPKERLEARLHVMGPHSRRISWRAVGREPCQVLESARD